VQFGTIGLTANDVAAILEYINHHYQIAYRRNKQSGSHSDFQNFVGTRHYLFYYHLFLNQAPHLLNFAVTFGIAHTCLVMENKGLNGEGIM
jgi:hypothetical protein